MESHQYIKTVFSQTIGPIELKFHVKTPYKLAKIYAKYFGHMAKMTATPIYGKKHSKIFSRSRKPVILELGMLHRGCGTYQVCSNDDTKLTLTYLTSRSNLLPNAFKWEIFGKVEFLNTVEASHYSHLIC